MRGYLIILSVAMLVPAGVLPVTAGEEPSGDEIQISQSGPIVVEKTSKEILIPKDPVIGAFLSFSIPGLGQVYAKKYLRGAFFFGTEAACFIAAGALVNIMGGYEYEIDDTDNETHLLEGSDFETLSDGAKAAVISTVVLGVALHIWNTVDAYHQAEKYNRETFMSSDTHPRITVGVDPGRKMFSLSLSQTFDSPF